ncbi:hypothetical protein [Janibacter sp. DB-40]|uniref:hypothetical protein n=1 Tax=Janibacter sp. DB-40 TaxID=3028808 RepID=UPI002406EC17|nr:hypothetical protein [Janibacter sp. DB-40]
MSGDPSGERPPRRPPPSLFDLWGRETVKDMVLLVAAVPVLACLLYVPVLATSGGSWPALLGLLVLAVANWLMLRLVLGRWVAAGTDRGERPPSHR